MTEPSSCRNGAESNSADCEGFLTRGLVLPIDIHTSRMKFHCVRCGNDFEIEQITVHDQPLTREQKDGAFKFCPFCHSGVRKFMAREKFKFSGS